jgi:hypothetical protein
LGLGMFGFDHAMRRQSPAWKPHECSWVLLTAASHRSFLHFTGVEGCRPRQAFNSSVRDT